MLVRFTFQIHLAWVGLGGPAHGFGFEGGLDKSFETNPKLCLKSDKWEPAFRFSDIYQS